jgi:hypothetical protein
MDETLEIIQTIVVWFQNDFKSLQANAQHLLGLADSTSTEMEAMAEVLRRQPSEEILTVLKRIVYISDRVLKSCTCSKDGSLPFLDLDSQNSFRMSVNQGTVLIRCAVPGWLPGSK